MKTIKTALTTAETSGKTLNKVLQNVRTTPIGPNLPSQREILHKCTEVWPDKPSQPLDFEEIRNYLIGQKELQIENHDQRHQAKPLPKLQPGHQVLFLSPAEQKSEYIQGTILSYASTPRSYKIEANGRIYCCTRQHIHTINVDTPIIRPIATKCQSLTISPRTATSPQHSVPVLQETALEPIIITPLKKQQAIQQDTPTKHIATPLKDHSFNPN